MKRVIELTKNLPNGIFGIPTDMKFSVGKKENLIGIRFHKEEENVVVVIDINPKRKTYVNRFLINSENGDKTEISIEETRHYVQNFIAAVNKMYRFNEDFVDMKEVFDQEIQYNPLKILIEIVQSCFNSCDHNPEDTISIIEETCREIGIIDSYYDYLQSDSDCPHEIFDRIIKSNRHSVEKSLFISSFLVLSSSFTDKSLTKSDIDMILGKTVVAIVGQLNDLYKKEG